MKDLSKIFYIEYGEWKMKNKFLKERIKGYKTKLLTRKDEKGLDTGIQLGIYL